MCVGNIHIYIYIYMSQPPAQAGTPPPSPCIPSVRMRYIRRFQRRGPFPAIHYAISPLRDIWCHTFINVSLASSVIFTCRMRLQWQLHHFACRARRVRLFQISIAYLSICQSKTKRFVEATSNVLRRDPERFFLHNLEENKP